jgi:hypothetical protein
VEEDDLTGDVELQHLQGRQVPELLSCTAVARCQILDTARSSKIGDLPPDGHWMGRFGFPVNAELDRRVIY